MFKVIAFMDNFATPTQLVALRETGTPRQSDKWKSWRTALNLTAIKVEFTAMEMLEVHESKVKESEKASNVKEIRNCLLVASLNQINPKRRVVNIVRKYKELSARC